MQLEFGYGSGVQTVELPLENLLGVLHAAPILVGRECYETVRCIDSDAADCIHLGDTAHGTPVDITRAVAEADFRTIILIGACPEGLGNKTLHCRICRTQAPITAGHNKLKSSRSQMRPAAFSDNMQVQAQTLRPM